FKAGHASEERTRDERWRRVARPLDESTKQLVISLATDYQLEEPLRVLAEGKAIPRAATCNDHMKKKSTSQSAFFNPRVLVGLVVGLAGVFLALLAFEI